MRSAMLLLSTGAGLGLATVAIAVGASADPDAVRAPRPPAAPAGGGDVIRGAKATARVGLREAPGRVRREPRPGRRARALLRAGQPLRLLPHAARGRAVVPTTGRRRCRARRARAAVHRRQSARRTEGRGSARPARSTISAATTRGSGTPASRATARSPTASSGPASTCACASRRACSNTSSACGPARGRRTSGSPTRGADGLSLDDSGALPIDTAAGRAARRGAGRRTRRPTARACPCRAATCSAATRTRSLRVRRRRSYQRDRELIIDPGVQYTTFLGGDGDEIGAGIVVDARRQRATSPAPRSRPTSRRRPARSGAPAPASNFADVFVTKLNAAGTALVYSTFIGGSDLEFGRGSRSTRRATPTSRARRSRRTSRPPAAPSTGPSTSRRTARGAASTIPTAS